MTRRRKYDRDFKRNAVLLCAEPDRTVAEVAGNLGIAKIYCTAGGGNTICRTVNLFFLAMVSKH